MNHDTGGDFDSNCYAAPVDAEGPTDDLCGRDATTFVYLRHGSRRYLCADHAAEVDRFGDTDDPHPRVVTCKRCQKPTPTDHVSHDGICDDCKV